MTEYHEPYELLPEEARDFHRALKSLQEELEAVDWYHQRVTQCTNAELRSVLEHNRDEEMEHACMVLEWLRRSMPGWDKNLRTYLFTEVPIVEVEAREEAGLESRSGFGRPAEPRRKPPSPSIGSLKEKR